MHEFSNSDGMGWIPPQLANMTMGASTRQRLEKQYDNVKRMLGKD